jgi:hypothetical protein
MYRDTRDYGTITLVDTDSKSGLIFIYYSQIESSEWTHREDGPSTLMQYGLVVLDAPEGNYGSWVKERDYLPFLYWLLRARKQ